jgi:hypothetical protein
MALAALSTGKRAARTTVINDTGSWTLRRPPVPQPRRRAGPGGHAPEHRQVEQRVLLHAGQRDGRGRHARLHEAAGLWPDHRHRHQRRGARRAAQPRLEAQAPTRSPSSKSGMPAKPFRWASARATTTSPCCNWRRPRPRWPRRCAAQAAPGDWHTRQRLAANCDQRQRPRRWSGLQARTHCGHQASPGGRHARRHLGPGVCRRPTSAPAKPARRRR